MLARSLLALVALLAAAAAESQTLPRTPAGKPDISGI